MRYWVEDAKPPFKDPEGLFCDATPNYVYVVDPFENGKVHGEYTYYIMMPSDGFYVIAACWGHRFDKILEGISDPKKGGKGLYKEFCRMWPTFGRLFDNALSERYSSGALLRFRDPDDGEIKCFIATVVGNISASTVGDLVSHPRILKAMELVKVTSRQMFKDVANHPVSSVDRLRFFGRGFAIGAMEALAWEQKIFKALYWLGGGG